VQQESTVAAQAAPAPHAAVAPRGGHSVTIERISRAFGGMQAVDDVSLEIEAGEFLSILGPSGCGKTTLLRMIAGLEHPDDGRILIDERDVTDLPPNKRPTNLVFQRGALFPHKTVFENVAYPLERGRRPRGEIAGLVDEALRMVRLGDLGRRRPSELSGGQAQRVALARALVSKPAVLLLDEPLSALDLALRKEMQLELRRLQDELGTTFVYVTHDQEEALTMSTRIVIMRGGRIVQIGSPREIYERPDSVFASTFVGESNLLLGEVTGAGDGVVHVRAAGRELRVAGEPADAGSSAALSIRPERIACLPAGAEASGDANRLPGTVREVVFLGNRVRASVSCGELTLWVERSPAAPEAALLTEGAAITLGWAAGDARLIVPDPE
jgi:spermidine/putrescine transport system ATP-binding protein